MNLENEILQICFDILEKEKTPLEAQKEILRLLDVVGQSEQFYCSSYEDGEWRCETQCLGCAGLEEQVKQ